MHGRVETQTQADVAVERPMAHGAACVGHQSEPSPGGKGCLQNPSRMGMLPA
jgi:hypothetical protein